MMMGANGLVMSPRGPVPGTAAIVAGAAIIVYRDQVVAWIASVIPCPASNTAHSVLNAMVDTAVTVVGETPVAATGHLADTAWTHPQQHLLPANLIYHPDAEELAAVEQQNFFQQFASGFLGNLTGQDLKNSKRPYLF